MDINLAISSVIKMFALVIMIDLISIKLINNKHNKKHMIFFILESLIFSLIYLIIQNHTNTFIVVSIIYMITSCLIKVLFRYKIGHSMLIAFVAIAICLISFTIAVFMSYFLLRKILYIESHIVNIILIINIQIILLIMFFKIKRFRNGFDFLKRKNQSDYIDMIMLTVSSIILVTYSLLGNPIGDALTIRIFILLMFLATVMIILVEKALEMYYKQNLLKREIQEYQTELKEKDNIIKKLSNEKYEISRINHEFYNRQKALELKVKEFTSETSNDIGILDRIENLTKEYSQNLQNIKGKEKLQLTSIPELDDMFSYMQSECKNNNIDFKLQIQGEIYYLVNNIIPTNKLETLIGDLLRNAIIAINSSDNKYKSILTILGIKEKCYELCVCDSGIEFEINTLLKLGLERATTHKETGGSGIGFMTTFKTLEETKASLIIEEKHEMQENDYTKAIKIRFDGKNEYKIISYRADSIKEKCKGEKRIIIYKI